MIIKEVPQSKKIFVIKHTMDMCGMGKFMKIWVHREIDSCPQCGNPEDAGHVWICDQMSASEVWDKALLEFSQWMASVQTDPELQSTTIDKLSEWHSGSPTSPKTRT
jgi:hypothetical protein